jgi:hypothetical protein
MIAVKVYRQVGPEIIRNAKLISLRVKKSLRAAIVINSFGQGDGPAGTIHNIE